ncbi:hypothetical protein pdam_00021330, partial [Pocillopora damicornis]
WRGNLRYTFGQRNGDRSHEGTPVSRINFGEYGWIKLVFNAASLFLQTKESRDRLKVSSPQVFMAVLSPMDVIRRVYIEKYKTHGDTSSANFVDVLFGGIEAGLVLSRRTRASVVSRASNIFKGPALTPAASVVRTVVN